MRALITGVTGFVGTHLAGELHRNDPETEIWGLAWGDLDRRRLERVAPGIVVRDCDLLDRAALGEILDTFRPQVIYHLAAESSVAKSWESAVRALEVNAIGSAGLFEAVLSLGLDPVVLISSTAEIYGRISDTDTPVDETTPLAPVSPYGTSKTAQDLLAAQFYEGRDLATVRLRFFHLTGPGRPPHFVASSFARQIARAELGLAPPKIAVGNLESVRDFTDVRDAVRACRLASDPTHAGDVFHVCSGRGVTISKIVDTLLDLSPCDIEIEVDRDRLRRADIPWLVGDPSKIEAATGWRAEIPLRQTLSDLLDWWRGAVSADEGRTT